MQSSMPKLWYLPAFSLRKDWAHSETEFRTLIFGVLLKAILTPQSSFNKPFMNNPSLPYGAMISPSLPF